MPDGSWHDVWCTSVSMFVCQHYGEEQNPPSPPPPVANPPCPMCDTCTRLLSDDGHMFRRMWGAEPWLKIAYDRATCFERTRDRGGAEYQDSYTFFDLTQQGLVCDTNWYEGNFGDLGVEGRMPTFPAPAPALLGFDETIDDFCSARRQANGDWGEYMNHAENCRLAGMNILSLYGQRLPYNICRNLEWITCAANGLLPGQKGLSIVFAKAPRMLDFRSGSTRLGVCSGWRPDVLPKDCSDFGYATDSIFYLETCLFNQICENNRDMWTLNVGEEFVCEFSQDKWMELKDMLMRRPTSYVPPQKCFNSVGKKCKGVRFDETCCNPGLECFKGVCADPKMKAQITKAAATGRVLNAEDAYRRENRSGGQIGSIEPSSW